MISVVLCMTSLCMTDARSIQISTNDPISLETVGFFLSSGFLKYFRLASKSVSCYFLLVRSKSLKFQRRWWHPSPVLLPGKSHGRRSLVGCSMGSRRVGHDWATSLSLFTSMHWRRKWQPTPVFLPGESQGPEAWWAAVSGVAQSRTRLKRLSSRSTPLSFRVASLPCFCLN